VARGNLETAEDSLGELRALPAGLHAEAHMRCHWPGWRSASGLPQASSPER
jgi:hypothetical protein